jgi:hypothetical protein
VTYPQDADRWYSDGRGYEDEPPRRGGSRHANSYEPDPLGDSFAEQYRAANPNSDVREYGTVPPPAGRQPASAMPAMPTMPVPQQPMPQQVPPQPVSGAPDANFPTSGYPTSGGPGPRLMVGTPSQQSGEMSLDELSRHHAESIDRTQLRRTVPPPQGGMPPQGPPMGPPMGDPQMTGGLAGLGERPGSVYRGKRPGLAALLIGLTVLFEIPVFRIFFSSALAHDVNAPGTISAIFMILGLPMFGLGLYGLIGGAAAAAHGARAWLRVPLAYLPLGLALFLAAALT